jgi:hypothetical protein
MIRNQKAKAFWQSGLRKKETQPKSWVFLLREKASAFMGLVY